MPGPMQNRRTTTVSYTPSGMHAVQIYSYGLQPYYGYSNQDVVELIRTNQLLTCPVGCPPSMYALLLDCWHPVPSSRPHFDVVHRRLRDSAVGTGSGSASGGSATTAGCCGTDRLYESRPVCPGPTACLQRVDAPPDAQFYGRAVEQYNVAADCPPQERCLVPPDRRRPDDTVRWPPTAGSDTITVGTDDVAAPDTRPGCRPMQPSSAAGGGGQSSSTVNRSTTSTSASTTPRNSHHQARSSSSSASDAKSRRVTSSERDHLTLCPPPR